MTSARQNEPFIAHVHGFISAGAILVEAMDDDGVQILDPAVGQRERRCRDRNSSRIWDGTAIGLTENSQKMTEGKRPSPLVSTLYRCGTGRPMRASSNFMSSHTSFFFSGLRVGSNEAG